jgi:hypothetical protein
MSGFQHSYSTALISSENGGPSDAVSRPCKQRCSRMPNGVVYSVTLHARSANFSIALASPAAPHGQVDLEKPSLADTRAARNGFPPPDPWMMAR